MKLEDYDEETYRYLYKIFKEFHQEIIHNHTTTQARTAFANLLAEETNLTEEEIQAHLYCLQEEIHQFRQKRGKYLKEKERRKAEIRHSSLKQTTTVEEQLNLLETFGKDNPETFEELIQQTPIKQYFKKTVKSPVSKPETQASSSNIKRKQVENPTPIVQEQPQPIVEENLLESESEQEEMDQNFQQLVTGLNNLVNALGQGNREAKYAKITDFYGDTQDPVGWLQDFENTCQANAINDNRKMQIVGAYLKGTAAIWLANKRLIENWPTQWNPANANHVADQNASFTYQFRLQFRTQDRVYEWQRQLKERKQLPGESVEQYAAAVRELLR